MGNSIVFILHYFAQMTSNFQTQILDITTFAFADIIEDAYRKKTTAKSSFMFSLMNHVTKVLSNHTVVNVAFVIDLRAV